MARARVILLAAQATHVARSWCGRELYDFAKDPLNKTDVAAQHPDIVTRLGKELDGWHQMAVAAKLKPDAEATKSIAAFFDGWLSGRFSATTAGPETT